MCHVFFLTFGFDTSVHFLPEDVIWYWSKVQSTDKECVSDFISDALQYCFHCVKETNMLCWVMPNVPGSQGSESGTLCGFDSSRDTSESLLTFWLARLWGGDPAGNNVHVWWTQPWFWIAFAWWSFKQSSHLFQGLLSSSLSSAFCIFLWAKKCACPPSDSPSCELTAYCTTSEARECQNQELGCFIPGLNIRRPCETPVTRLPCRGLLALHVVSISAWLGKVWNLA